MSEEIGEKTLKRLQELIDDGTNCARLTDFERGFLESLSEKLARYKARTFMSGRQMEIVEQIEGKVYA